MSSQDPAPGPDALADPSRIVEEVLTAVRGTSIADLEIEWTGGRVRVRRDPKMATPRVILDEAPPPHATDEPVVVRSAYVGTFHHGSGGRSAEPGDAVAAGDALAEVETLRMRNVIRAPVDGKLAEIVAADGTPVEYGQPLLVIQPTPLGSTP